MGEILLPRRRPAQARSRERFERILQAARAVLVDVGFESFTVDEVAHRAGVPIGTLYQYFANKYVLVCELDRQDTAASRAEIERFSRRAPDVQWPDVLDETIDHLARMWRDDPPGAPCGMPCNPPPPPARRPQIPSGSCFSPCQKSSPHSRRP